MEWFNGDEAAIAIERRIHVVMKELFEDDRHMETPDAREIAEARVRETIGRDAWAHFVKCFDIAERKRLRTEANRRRSFDEIDDVEAEVDEIDHLGELRRRRDA